jgi:hypothetical protein
MHPKELRAPNEVYETTEMKRLLFLLLLLNACGPTRAYTGPEVPVHETSIIYFYDMFGVTLTELEVDGVDQGFGVGIQVLPGEHAARVRFSVKQRNCSFGSSWCATETSYGLCSAVFTTKKGTEYRLEISGLADKAWISVLEAKGRVPAGTGSCKVTDTDIAYDFKG